MAATLVHEAHELESSETETPAGSQHGPLDGPKAATLEPSNDSPEEMSIDDTRWGEEDMVFDPGDEEETRIHVATGDSSPTLTQAQRHLLLSLSGTEYGRVIALEEDRIVVGRGAECHIVLAESEISRQHARLRRVGGGYLLEDLASSNGTFVNGVRVVAQALEAGDLVTFGPSALFRFTSTDSTEEAVLRRLYEASVVDALTGARRRAYVDMRLAEEVSFTRRRGTDLSVLMLDLDHFKAVNDRYGHPVGDQILAVFGTRVAAELREEDVFGRYGGEEFLVILRSTDLAQARVVAERIRRAVESLEVEHDGDSIRVSVTIGVASDRCCDPLVAARLVEIADRRLYAAKRQGRNRVETCG